MRDYSPKQPMISLHVPKCAGQSMRKVLQTWFRDRFHIHYFQQYNDLPPHHPLKPGICIHGHFNNTKGFGTQNYYPEVDQFITFLRNPVEVMISNYFFWKRKARGIQLASGALKEGGAHDYRDINDFFDKRPECHFQNFLPAGLTLKNFKEELPKKFIYIGVVEDMNTSLRMLSKKLGFEPPGEVWLNQSERDEELPDATRKEFIKNNPFAFEIYAYARQNYK
jgi:hypothetical protein